MARRDSTWMWIAGLVGLGYLASKSGLLPTIAAATPYSIYPEFAYTAQTTMAATPSQHAPAAVIPPTGQYTSVQQQEQAALIAQCAGSWPNCTPLSSDWQLGL